MHIVHALYRGTEYGDMHLKVMEPHMQIMWIKTIVLFLFALSLRKTHAFVYYLHVYKQTYMYHHMMLLTPGTTFSLISQQ